MIRSVTVPKASVVGDTDGLSEPLEPWYSTAPTSNLVGTEGSGLGLVAADGCCAGGTEVESREAVVESGLSLGVSMEMAGAAVDETDLGTGAAARAAKVAGDTGT